MGHIVFDVGNVLLNARDSGQYAELGITPNFWDVIRSAELSDAWQKLDCGFMKVEQVCEELCRLYPEYDSYWRHHIIHGHKYVTTYPDMLNWLKELTAEGHTLYMLSNWSNEWCYMLEELMEAYPFQDAVISCKVGICKPDRRIFEYASTRFDIPAHELIFIDDRLDNCQTAQELGWRTIQHKDYLTTRRAFYEMCD